MEIRPILENIRCSAAAPTPKILANEQYVYLVFYLEDTSVQDAENSPFNRVPVDQICAIRFDKYSEYQLRDFDVDQIRDHEYATYGLTPYTIQEVIYLEEKEDQSDNEKVHLIFPFKNSCFEIVCEGYQLLKKPCQTMREEVLRLAELV